MRINIKPIIHLTLLTLLGPPSIILEKIRIIVYPSPDGALGRVCVYSEKKYNEFIDRSRRDDSQFRLDESLWRTKFLARELSMCNPWDYFCTFTFSPERVDRTDYKEVSHKLRVFFNNYRKRKSKDFRYMVVPESHTKDGIHFHGLVRGIRPQDLYVPDMILKRFDVNDYESEFSTELRWVPNTPGYLRWRDYTLGFMDLSPVRDHFRCSSYILKYITKSMQRNDFLVKGDHILLHSQGLRKSIEICKSDIDYKVLYPLIQSEFGSPLIYQFCDVFQDVPMDKIDGVLNYL